MANPIDLTNKKFGRLTVIKLAESVTNTYGRPIRRWVCDCECGNTTIVRVNKLTSGNTISCGCFQKEMVSNLFKTHGKRHTKEYASWASMKARCLNENSTKFHLWGGRNISICDRWIDSFENFYADMGPRPEGTSIDRIDTNGNYEPLNCRWATPKQQSNNLRTTRFFTVNDITDTISGFAERLGCSRDAIKLRLKRGQTMEYIYSALKK